MKKNAIHIIFALVALSFCFNSCIQEDMIYSTDAIGISVNTDNFVNPGDLGIGELTSSAQIIRNGQPILSLDKHVLYDSPIINDEPYTKGSVVNTGNLSSFAIDGFLRSSVTGVDEHYINGKTANKTADGWKLYESGTTPFKWIYSSAIKFWARYPDNLSVSFSADRNSMSFSYTLPAHQSDNQDATRQKDILYSTNQASYSNGTAVDFNFGHALSAVRIDFTDLPDTYTIKKVSLANILNSGTCVVSASTTTAVDYSWTLGTTKGTYVQTITPSNDLGTETIGGETRTAVMKKTSDKIFFVPPQLLPSDAEIILTIEEDGTEYDVSCSLDGDRWSGTCIYTYSVSGVQTDWEYIVEGLTPISVEYNGGNSIETGYLKSYRQKTSDPTIKEVVPWSFEYSTDNVSWSSTKPSWLNFNKISGNGSLTGEEILTSVSAQTYVEATKSAADAHKTNLQTAQQKGTSSNRFDLSCYNVATGQNISGLGRCTANMYVVNASGYYKFPIVYGNALKFDQFNEDAVIADPLPTGADPAGYTRYLTHFVNHDDMPITSPWIKDGKYKNGGTIGTSGLNAVVIWQDSQNLVTNVGIDGDYITFDVANTSIAQGNCVIAVRNSDNVILWSWQIWVTDEQLTQTENFSYHGQQYHFMKVNLGWYSAGDLPCKSYVRREYYVRANNGHASYTFKVTQNAHEEVGLGTRGSCTYYQWGRKDPVPGGDGTTTAKTRTLQYPAGSQYTFRFVYGSDLGDHEYVSIGKSIQRPYYMNHAWNDMGGFYIDWNNKHYHNLWSTNLLVPNGETSFNPYKSIPTVKTIYDPSPVGFKVPEANAFENFTSDNTTWNSTVKGWEYKVNGTATVFFPAVGCLSSGVMQLYTHWYMLYEGFNIWSSSPSGDVSTAYDFSADINNWPMINHSYFNKGNAQALHVITDTL